MDILGVVFVVVRAVLGLVATDLVLTSNHDERPSQRHKAWVRYRR